MANLLELEFLIDPVGEDLADKLAGEDVSVSWGPNYCTASTLLEPRDDAVSEALRLVSLLRKYGVSVRRPLPSLVNAAAIASRCEVSHPTVSEWTRDASFPQPFALVTSPIWTWHEVRRWVGQRARGRVNPDSEPDALSTEDLYRLSQKLSLHGCMTTHGISMITMDCVAITDDGALRSSTEYHMKQGHVTEFTPLLTETRDTEKNRLEEPELSTNAAV